MHAAPERFQRGPLGADRRLFAGGSALIFAFPEPRRLQPTDTPSALETPISRRCRSLKNIVAAMLQQECGAGIIHI